MRVTSATRALRKAHLLGGIMSDENDDDSSTLTNGSVLAGLLGLLVAGPVGLIAAAAVPAAKKAADVFAEGMARNNDDDEE
jgi:sugar phosphate permease